MAYVQFSDGVLWLGEYQCVLRKMTRQQVERVRNWDHLRLRSWVDILTVVWMVFDVIEQTLGEGRGDEWTHLWREQVVRDTRGPVSHVWHEQDELKRTEETEERYLYLRDDESVWGIVHEMSHIADIPWSEKERFNGSHYKHGKSFVSFVISIADAFELRLPEALDLTVEKQPILLERQMVKRSILVWQDLP